MWFSSSRLGPELSELFGQILHEVATSSKLPMEDAFCRSKGYYRNASADENRPRYTHRPGCSQVVGAVRSR